MKQSLIIAVVCVFAASMLFVLYEPSLREYFSGYDAYIGQPSKVVAVELDVPLEYRAFQKPTKCFSCAGSLPKESAYLANPTKCFSCERQYLQ